MAILYCNCANAMILSPDAQAAALDQLRGSGEAFETVDDLCELAARNDPVLGRLADEGPLKVFACHPRAVKNLLASAGVNGDAVVVVDLRGEAVARTAPGAWFPVIDMDRCTNCMQCLSFCLFGVYSTTVEGKIRVAHPDNCKTNCPACSRVCPEVAIMFPKYGAGPINGDAVSEADVRREKVKVDISALLGGDIYQTLRERNERTRSRFTKERDAGRALAERQKCMARLQQQLDIPPEVLRSLPSPDEIARKARQAQGAAQAALTPSNTTGT